MYLHNYKHVRLAEGGRLCGKKQLGKGYFSSSVDPYIHDYASTWCPETLSISTKCGSRTSERPREIVNENVRQSPLLDEVSGNFNIEHRNPEVLVASEADCHLPKRGLDVTSLIASTLLFSIGSDMICFARTRNEDVMHQSCGARKFQSSATSLLSRIQVYGTGIGKRAPACIVSQTAESPSFQAKKQIIYLKCEIGSDKSSRTREHMGFNHGKQKCTPGIGLSIRFDIDSPRICDPEQGVMAWKLKAA
ncbi:uncharacterized protein RAG0_06350 [Rhynchosporium agropyri]|uniref:Uncharacterized protein n=1 Tax=Rhynchosporium agropyri TaxID=914238 RepID=A0A1E1KGP9_9HELO|nr:uncharacterized protein RAG0_06350 [Rhynchosporium agropyri]